MEDTESPIWFCAISTSTGKVTLQVNLRGCPNEAEVASLMLVCPRRVELPNCVIMCEVLNNHTALVMSLPRTAECLLSVSLTAIRNALSMFVPTPRQNEKQGWLKIESLIYYMLQCVERGEWEPFLSLLPGLPRATLSPSANPAAELKLMLQSLKALNQSAAVMEWGQVVVSSPEYPDTVPLLSLLHIYLCTLPLLAAEFEIEGNDSEESSYQKCVFVCLKKGTHVVVLGPSTLRVAPLLSSSLRTFPLPPLNVTSSTWASFPPTWAWVVCAVEGGSVSVTLRNTASTLPIRPLLRLLAKEGIKSSSGCFSTDTYDVAWEDGAYIMYESDPNGFDADALMVATREAAGVIRSTWKGSSVLTAKTWKKLKW